LIRFSYIYRMKNILVAVSLLLVQFTSAQYWQPVGGGTNAVVSGFATYNGLLYVSGDFSKAGNTPASFIATWNGTKWDSVGGGIKPDSGGLGGAYPFVSYDSILYVAGQFSRAGNDSVRSIAQWNGTSWDSLGSGITNKFGWVVYSIAEYNGELYGGGNFIAYKSGIEEIVRWNGIKWDSVGHGTDDEVNAFTVYNNILYVGGYFLHAGGHNANYIASWDGTKWDSVGTGMNDLVLALAVYNNKLYAAGSFTTAGGSPANNIAVWNDTVWAPLGKGVNGGVRDMKVFNNKLYVAGLFDSAGGKPASEVASWDGVKWSNVGAGLTGGVVGLGVYDSSLYAGGWFTRSGKDTVNYIARWNDTLTGINEISNKVNNIKVFPNPSSNGKFTIEITNYELRIAGQKDEIEVYNMMGENIYNTHFIQTQNVNQIDLSGQPDGIYLYRIISNNGELIATGKLIIQ